MNHLPPTIRIGPFDFRTEPLGKLAAAAARRYGDFSAVELLIRVDYECGRWKVLDTGLHEILHAIWWAYGLEDGDNEERMVGALSTAWCQVFRDNPELVAWISRMRDPALPV